MGHEMKTKRRLFVFGTRGFPGVQGGVEKHCEALCPLLTEEFEVTVFRRTAYVEPMDIYRGVHFVDLPAPRSMHLEALIHSLRCALRCVWQRPDVVHVHAIGPGMFIPLLRLAGLHVVLTYHSANYEHRKWGRVARWLLRLSERIALGSANRIIFVSRSRYERQPERIKRKATWIPNGVTDMKRVPHHDFLDIVGARPGKYLLAVGRITQEKGFLELVRAFRSVTDNGMQLVIAGGEVDQSYMAAVRGEADERVLFVGAQPSGVLEELYSHTALFVLPSRNEEFPLVVMEALSCGAPLLLNDMPATRELSLPEECYFTMDGEAAIASAIERALSSPAPKVEFDSSRYDWQNIANQTLKVMREL
jgi:glycosyltransferase involved in cell wall biosynthesis